MVQLRASLEALVLKAWRDRWTELEWSVNLKAALAEDASEINKLCGLLLRQATLSEVPNKLIFNYLSYTVAAQVVSHASLLEAVVAYKDFNRELCIESILDLLNFIRDRLKCNSADAYQCVRLCSLLVTTLDWLVSGVESAVVRHNQNLLTELVTTQLAFVHNPFITLCLYFERMETPDTYHMLLERISNLTLTTNNLEWIGDAVKNDFRSFGQKLVGLSPMLFAPTRTVDPRELSPGSAHPTVITLASLYGSVRIGDDGEKLVTALHAVFESFRLPWWLVLRDFFRGALLLQLDPGPQFSEASVTAFVYLKIPRVLSSLVQRGWMEQEDRPVYKALEAIAGYHSLWNSLDIKNRSNCFHYLVDEMKKLNLINESESTAMTEIRTRDQSPFAETSPGAQAGIVLVLKAEPTFQTLIKSFSSEFASKQEKLVQMMYHMITGKSFEFICAAAAATSKLEAFTGKLIEFNKNALLPSSQSTSPEDAQVRSTMFDLSFLLLSKITYLYSCKVDTSPDSKTGFFTRWSEIYGLREDRIPSGINHNSTPESTAEALESLKNGRPFWDSVSCDWGEMCFKIPTLGAAILDGVKEHRLSVDQLKAILDTMQSEVCCFVLCFAQWLITQPSTDQRRTVTTALHSFLDSTPTGNDKKTHADRWNFMGGTVRKLLNPLLTTSPVHSPPYPWLINCGRRQLPQMTAMETPNNDQLKQGFLYALRQSWASSSVLALIDRCTKMGEYERWTRPWIDETLKLVSVDEMSLSCELCLGAAMSAPPLAILSLVEQVWDFVFENGHELYCVAPRGTVLARFMVQAFLLALQLQPIAEWTSTEEAGGQMEEPKSKMRRKEDWPMSMEESPEATGGVTSDPETAIRKLFRRFGECCEDGELRPAIYFIASFLRVLSEYSNPPAKRIIRLLPVSLLNQIIRTDPKIISAPTVLALHDVEDRATRHRALQNLCLLRQLRAL